ncbi:MAG: glycosyltransferase family 39 protein [Terriglobales bacterium]
MKLVVAMLAAKSIEEITSARFVFVVALAVRLVFGAATVISGVDIFRGNEPSHIAAHLAKGEGFSSPYGLPIAPTAQQPPVYPVLLAIIFKFLGVYSRAALAAIVALNAVAGAGIAALIYLVGRQYFSSTAAIVSAWAWVGWSEFVATDIFITNYTLSALAVLAWLRFLPAIENRKTSWFFLGGAVGLGILLNPTLVLVVIASAGWLRQRSPRLLAAAVVGCFVVVSPWIVRNYLTLHAFYPAMRDDLGMNLYMGNHRGMEENPQQCVSKLCEGTANFNNADFPRQDPGLFATLGEAEFMRQKQREAIAYIRSEPTKFLLRTAKRVASFWLVPHPVLRFVIFTLACAWLWRSSGPLRLFLLGVFGAYPIVFYMTQIAWVDWYRHPIEPLILLSAAAGGEYIYQGLRSRFSY